MLKRLVSENRQNNRKYRMKKHHQSIRSKLKTNKMKSSLMMILKLLVRKFSYQTQIKIKSKRHRSSIFKLRMNQEELKQIRQLISSRVSDAALILKVDGLISKQMTKIIEMMICTQSCNKSELIRNHIIQQDMRITLSQSLHRLGFQINIRQEKKGVKRLRKISR